MEREEQIRELCAKLLTTKDTIEAHTIGEELRSAIHEHIENLRQQAEILPILEAQC